METGIHWQVYVSIIDDNIRPIEGLSHLAKNEHTLIGIVFTCVLQETCTLRLLLFSPLNTACKWPEKQSDVYIIQVYRADIPSN